MAPVLDVPATDCSGGKAGDTHFSWSPVAGATEQWLDVSGIDARFEPGAYDGHGPLDGAVESLSVTGLRAGDVYYWRVSALTDDGRLTSEARAFVPCGPSRLLGVSYTCDGPYATARFDWAPATSSVAPGWQRWLEEAVYDRLPPPLLESDPAQQPSFATAGIWPRLVANVAYEYRFSEPVSGGWRSSETGELHPRCDYLTELPCDDALAPLDKQNRLGPECAPEDLVTLDPGITVGEQSMKAEAAGALVSLFEAAAADGHALSVASSYRSYETQVATFDSWVAQLGRAEAERVSAWPGHSEHQLGTTADVTSATVDFQLTTAFAETPEGRWLAGNARRFGFAISYAANEEDVTGYSFEPWHIRYVGVEMAERVHEANITLHEQLLLDWYGRSDAPPHR